MDWTSATPTGDRPAADAELVGELGVDPLAVLDELVVAVLEAGPGDEGRALAAANACAQSSVWVTPSIPSASTRL